MRGKVVAFPQVLKPQEVSMSRPRILTGLLLLLTVFAPGSQAQLGKNILIPAGSEADHQLSVINATADPAQKLQLIDQFSQAHPDGDLQIVADEQYVNYYINTKQYDKAFEYGDKLFAMDPDNFSNAVNMVRATSEKGDTARLFSYGEKAGAMVQRYKKQEPPPGTSAEMWNSQKAEKLASIKESLDYIEQLFLNAASQQKDPAKRADYLARFAKDFPDSAYAPQALSAAAVNYQQAQNPQKMLDLANGVLAKDPINIGMLLLLADYYSDKPAQLDQAETYAKKVASLCETAKKPDGMTAEEWQKQNNLQKGAALSTLGQVNMEKKDNASAVKNLTAASPLLKADPMTYARNQYRLGYAYLNLKNGVAAKQALTEAASVDSPYKAMAQKKLNEMSGAKPAAKKKAA
jgi:tetratricopeptide (TPR) repeat protein